MSVTPDQIHFFSLPPKNIAQPRLGYAFPSMSVKQAIVAEKEGEDALR